MALDNTGRLSRSWPLAVILATLLPAAAAAARKENTPIPLTYTPTNQVAASSAAPTAEIRAVPAALLITDERALPDKSVIGNRTDDDDRRSEVRASSDVATFVQRALTKQARDWTFAIAEAADAGVLLVGRITRFQLEETNQAVGASYGADVTLDFELRDRSGTKKAAGTYQGDATRYGKAFSAQNTNEVLSDALAEAFANALSDSAIRAAWAGDGAAATASASAPMTPEAALAEVKRQMAKGVGEGALQDALRKVVLTRALGADDLAAWKAAGVPESVIRVAATLRVE